MEKLLTDSGTKELTPEIIAELFAALCSEEQARFFNHVDKVASTWGCGGWHMQLQCITDDDGLDLGGRRVMQMIGEYSHWGLVPHPKAINI